MAVVPGRASACCTVVLLLAAGRATASPVVFSAVDHEAEPSGPFSGRPNCTAADLAWTAGASALGPIWSVNFEDEGLQDDLLAGSFGPGMTLTGGRFHIRDHHGSAVEGFNTTPGGSRYAKADGSTSGGSPLVYTFSFDEPVQAFSVYLTGVGNRFGGSMSLSFNNGQPQVVPLTNLWNLGGAQFVGFTDGGMNISTVSLTLSESPNNVNAARLSIDDARWVLAVPSPGGAGLLVLAGVAGARRRR